MTKTTAHITVQITISAYGDSSDPLPTPEQVLAAYLDYSGGEILTGKELAESGYVQSRVQMEIISTDSAGT